MNTVKSEQLQRFLNNLQIGNRAVQQAQNTNRSLGIPNWYSVNGIIVSDQQLKTFKKTQNNKS